MSKEKENISSTTIGFEQAIWNAACKLRILEQSDITKIISTYDRYADGTH